MAISAIYEQLKNRLQRLLGINISKYSLVDQMLYAYSDALDEAYQEIEKNKTPHIYSSLKGKKIDDLGVLIGCYRYENESDDSYLARIMAHRKTYECANRTAIETMLAELKYSSNASYTPFTQGTGTATVHFIPIYYDDETIEKAREEIKKRLKKVVAPDSYIKIQVAEPISVRIIAYTVFDEPSEYAINEIKEKVKAYVNSVPIGSTLSYGMINRIGLSQKNVTYFNTVSIYLNGEKVESLDVIQTIQKKFLFDDILIQVVAN